MTAHPLETLARHHEDPIGDPLPGAVRQHVIGCSACAEFARSLAGNDKVLRDPSGPLPGVPPMRARPAGRRPIRVHVLAVAALVAAVVVGIGLGQALRQIRQGPAAHPPSQLHQDRPFRLAYVDAHGHHFVVADEGGRELRRVSTGGRAHSFAVHPSGTKVAAWVWRDATTHLTEGDAELVVWDVPSGAVSTLLRAPGEWPGGAPLWSPDGAQLTVALTTVAPPSAERGPAIPPRSTRLLVVAADGSGTRVLDRTVDQHGLQPVAFTARYVAAVGAPAPEQRQRYVLFDARTGERRLEAAVPHAPSFMYGVDASRDIVFSLIGHFTDSPVHVLRIWRIDEPHANVIEVRAPRISHAVLWPGRSEVVFGVDTRLRAVGIRSGAIRDLASEDHIVMPDAFTPNGDRLVVKRVVAPVLQLYEARPDQTIALTGPLRMPVTIPSPRLLGWVRD